MARKSNIKLVEVAEPRNPISRVEIVHVTAKTSTGETRQWTGQLMKWSKDSLTMQLFDSAYTVTTFQGQNVARVMLETY